MRVFPASLCNSGKTPKFGILERKSGTKTNCKIWVSHWSCTLLFNKETKLCLIKARTLGVRTEVTQETWGGIHLSREGLDTSEELTWTVTLVTWQSLMGRSQAQLATIGRCRTVTEPLSFLNSLSTRLRTGGPVTPCAPPPVNYGNIKQFGLAQLAECNTCSIAVAEQWQLRLSLAFQVAKNFRHPH